MYATQDATVSQIYVHATGGNTIILSAPDVRLGYAHSLPNNGLTIGQRVDAGDTIGTTNVSGASTGPHLHFSVTSNGVKIDPMTYLGDSCGSL